MKTLKNAFLLFLSLVILTGVIYPAVVTLAAQGLFPAQAGGSLVYDAQGKLAGSSLIAQEFMSPRYFISRPSATAGSAYNPLASGGSNLGPGNPQLIKQIQDRAAALKAAGFSEPIPSDLVMASGSGLDPEITWEAALYQTPSIAEARNLTQDKIISLLVKFKEKRQFGVLGDDRVNVLKLNLALDKL